VIVAVVVISKVTMGGNIAAFYRYVAGLPAEVLEENVDTYYSWNE
jgi:hypothetical protein